MTPNNFRDALARAVDHSGRTQVDIAREAGIAPGAIGNWLAGGIANPDPSKVFAVERALGLDPGSLSRTLGYIPVDAEDVPPVDVQWAIENDPKLQDRVDRRALVLLYRTFLERNRLAS